ncbi:DMT family transporter [Rhodospirillaceae bacterium KN72]|uniref:DMT family transporter n=1 Tax=Pacificispira spongiicola TaxID=2729598 RepID=A0A7Y0E2I7_9PROT|nr:DMT family transporter [Pacificispira spongiicola]NMM46052.1 DMT family transporter [Pacificispira spongiicola]
MSVTTAPETPVNRNTRAILNVVIGTALFSLFFASGKFAGDGASAFQITFLRYIGGLATILTVAKIKGLTLRSFIGPSSKSHFLRAATGCFGGVALIHASSEMPVVDVSTIGLLYVVMVIPLGVIFLKERIWPLQWAGIVLSSIGAGVIMVSKGAFQSFDIAYFLPAGVALGGAVLLAFEGVLIRVLSLRDGAMSSLLHVNVFGLILMAVPAFATWENTDLVYNAQFLLWGPVAIAAQFFIIQGYRLADVSIVGPVDYTWLVFAAAVGFFFFGEIPSPDVVIGASLIAAGGVVLCLVKAR